MMLAATAAFISSGGDTIVTNGLRVESSNESIGHAIFMYIPSLTFAFAISQ